MIKSDLLKIVAFGDSITEGTYGGADSAQTWPFVLRYLLNEAGIRSKVIKMGLPGETAPEGLRRFKRHVVRFNPGIVLIMYGANDSYAPSGNENPAVSAQQFMDSLEQMILQSKEHQILPVLMTTTPISLEGIFSEDPQTDNSHNANVRKYMGMVNSIALKNGVHLIDHFRVWMEMDENVSILQKYLPDGVHPNVEGNRLIAQTIFNALKEIIHHEIIG